MSLDFPDRRRAPALLGPDAQLSPVAVRRAADPVSLRRLPRTAPPYLPHDYRADARAVRRVAHVYIETEWDPNDPVGEMRYVDALRREHGLPTRGRRAGLARTAPTAPQCSSPRRAGRSCAACATSRAPTRRPADAEPGGMTDAAWRAGFARLARYGLHFELQTPWWHLHEAAQLARDFPDTPIVLNHTGLPADRSAEGLAGWRRAMARARAVPQRRASRSPASAWPGVPWTVAANRDIVLHDDRARSASQRCMFASNFPVDGLCAPFADHLRRLSTRSRATSRPIDRAPRAVPRQRAAHLRRMRRGMTMDKPRIGYVGIGLMGLPMTSACARSATRCARSTSCRAQLEARARPARRWRARRPMRRKAPISCC